MVTVLGLACGCGACLVRVLVMLNADDWFCVGMIAQGQPRFAVLSSLFRTARYHLGSIVFGSLLITTLQLVRVALHYLQRHVKKLTASRIVNALFVCIQCCLKCFQTIIEVVTRDTYIFVSGVRV